MAKKNKTRRLGFFPYLSVIFGSTISLIIIGIFTLFLFTGIALQNILKNNIELQVYLDHNISENKIHSIKQNFLQSSYLSQSEENLSFVSKEMAAEEFVEDTGEDFVKFLGDNPLRSAFVLKIEKSHHSTDSMQMLQTRISAMDGVFEVNYTEDITQKIISNVSKLSILLVSLAIFAAFVVGSMINNTIKLALFSQRFLIRSMQLVGAKPSFIYKPFLRNALLYGIVSGLLASGTIYAFVEYLSYRIPDFSLLINTDEILKMSLILIIIGCSFSVLGTYRSINKYLKMKLDELF